MSLLDQLLGGYVYAQQNGTTAPTQKTLNFVGATVADDPGNSRTTITVTPSTPAITELTTDVIAGPGSGSQAALVAEATGELTGPGGVASWWFPNKAGSIALCNSPDGSPVAIYRNPVFPGNPNGAYAMIAADAGIVSVGGAVIGIGDSLITAIKSQFSVEVYGRAGRLVLKTSAKTTNVNQSLIGIYQPFRFSNAEVYLGGAGPFDCDTGLYATTLIECNFAGGLAGIVNLPGVFAPPDTDPGRVIYIADAAATINAVATLALQPRPDMSVAGGALGVPLVISTAGWARTLVLDSTGVNWMIFG